MKVALVCPYDVDRHGGVQHQVGRLVAWLNAAGHEAWIVAPGGEDRPDVRSVGGVVEVPANGARTPIALAPRVAGRVTRAVAGADVVHIHEPFMPLVSLAALLADTPPKVGTFHADPAQWTRRLYRGARRLAKRWIGRLGAVTAVSPVAASALGDLTTPRIVPNGLDVDAYASAGERDPVRVVFVGRDDPRKGLDDLLTAWPAVVAEVPDAELVVVGAARDHGPPRVRFLGPVSDEVKRTVLGGSAVLCAPNRGGESFGIVVAEGMAAGCAVVATGIPAFVNVLGEAGVYVAPDDPDGLGRAVASLLADPVRRADLAAAAAQRVVRFDKAAVLAGYVAAYEAALETAVQRPG